MTVEPCLEEKGNEVRKHVTKEKEWSERWTRAKL